MYIVILAGGGGTRLRPLSRPDRPKPFLPLLGEETLFQRTVRRVASLVGPDDIHCVADARYAALIAEQAPNVRLIAEPAGRNTAPAIALAAASIDRPDDEVMVVLPADHSIRDEEGFRAVLHGSAELARGGPGVDGPLVTLGVTPDRPAVEYGYLMPDLDRRLASTLEAYVLRAFEEKPDAARAAQLLAQPGVAWNAGMFVWTRAAIRDAIATYTKLAPIEDAVRACGDLAGAYAAVEPVAIDVAVMEPAARDGRVVMGAMDVGWSDLGSWTALLQALEVPAIDARLVQAGESVQVTPDDLVVARRPDGLLAVPGTDGTMTADATIALLRGARRFETQVDDLLVRCSGA